MATNVVFDEGNQLTVDVIANTESGDPVVFGNQPGVALTDRDAAGQATVKFNGVIEVALEAAAAGDAVYIVPSTGVLSLTDDATMVFFGVAINDADADTDIVRVRIGGIEPGSGS